MDKKAEGQVVEGEGPAPLARPGCGRASKFFRNRNLDPGCEVGVGRPGPGGGLAGGSREVLCVRRELRAPPHPSRPANAAADPRVPAFSRSLAGWGSE